MKDIPLGSYSTPEMPAARRKSFQNGSAGKGNYPGKQVKGAFEGRKVSTKVNMNINFSELDEVCLDVGKVDLSYSAKLRNDINLTPSKGSGDKINDSNKVSLKSANGYPESYCVQNNNNIIELEQMKIMRSCYVQLESLGPMQKMSSSGMRMRVSVQELDGAEDEEWKGWRSKISFSEEHGCPKVEVMEGSELQEVLVMSEDLVDSECRILEKNNGHKLDRKNWESVFGSPIQSKKNNSYEEKTTLKRKLCDLFANTSELKCFLESVDISETTPKFQSSPKRSFCRKLNFCAGDEVPTFSNGNVQNIMKERSKVFEDIRMSSDTCEDFLGFSESAITSSEKCARHILDYYEREKCIIEMM